MGVGAGLYMYVVVVQKFTFAISSPDEFLYWLVSTSGVYRARYRPSLKIYNNNLLLKVGTVVPADDECIFQLDRENNIDDSKCSSVILLFFAYCLRNSVHDLLNSFVRIYQICY